MTNDDVPTPSSPARISIRVGDDAFHVEGPEEVVERAMQRWLARIDRMARNNGFGPLLADDLGALGLVNTADAPEAPAPVCIASTVSSTAVRMSATRISAQGFASR